MIPIEVETRIALFLFSTIPSRRYRFKSILVTWIGYTELDRKDKVCILKETHWRNLSCQRAERDAVTQMNLNIKS